MIFRCGITGSGRKATCRNGSGRVHAEASGRLAQRVERVADGLEGAVAHQAGDRQRQLGPDRAVGRHHEAALDLDQAVHGRRHVAVVGADDADVVAVVADGGGDGAALQAEPVHEAAADVAVRPVPGDDRDLDDILGEVDQPLAAAARAGRGAGAR